MKKFVVVLLLLCILGISYVFRNQISDFLVTTIDKINSNSKKADILNNNEYASNNNYKFISLTDNFYPKNIQDVKNIYYTVIQSGMEKFTFYCDKSYDNCLNDVDYVSNNQKLLSYINDFVPVYNSFKNIETEFDDRGKITINLLHTYTSDDIDILNLKIDKIINENIKDNMSNEEKIKTIHDYIINNAKYDVDRSDNKVTTYHSDTAYGTLIEGFGICGGYADSMKLFLDRFGIPNFKVSSENHIWNAVYLNDKWVHLDLTWDDPVNKNGEDILEYTYYLISTDELLELEKDQHSFDQETFLELKEN